MGISAPDFAYVRGLVRQRSAIDLQPGKEYLVESRLISVARAAGADDLSSLVSRIRAGDERLEEAVVDAMTTNETSWFRDVHPFDAFTSQLLPEIATTSQNKEIVVWSAGCSTGQEAYSLAMLLLDWLPAHPGFGARIIGTDISRSVIERAQRARYSQLEVNRGLRAPQLVAHFDQVGRDWVLREQVRRLCRFQQGNLVEPLLGLPMCDVVFLRNVLIYFDLDTKRAVLANVRTVLRPGGFLVLGGAESTLNLDAAFERLELGRAVVFRHTGGTR